MPKHVIWSIIRRRLEWFRTAERMGITYSCRYFGISRKTYYKWFNRYITSGKDPKALQDRSRRPKTHPKTTPKEVVKVIVRLRKRTSFGPRRLQFYLKRDYHISISVCGIYKVLHRQGLIKRFKRKKKRYQSYGKYISYPGQKVQLDVKYVKDKQKTLYPRFYQYSAKDLYPKLRLILIYDDLSVNTTENFVEKLIRFFPFKIKNIQTDHGIEFTFDFLSTPLIHPIDKLAKKYRFKHSLIPVATPRYNGQVERSHRTDEEEFYRRVQFKNLSSLQAKSLRYLRYYNQQRPHIAITMLTPLQKLRSVNGSQHANVSYKRCYP